MRYMKNQPQSDTLLMILNSCQAAKALGVSPRRVLAIIKSGRLPAVKVGRDWIILKSDLKKVSIRVPGRPPKKKG